MTSKKNYVCIIQLLNFKQITLTSGRDLLNIRVDNILTQVKRITQQLPGLLVEVLGDKIRFTLDDNNQLERFIELIMDYTKQSLLFGLPHKAIIFEESPIIAKENNLNLYVSKEYFLAIEKLEKLDLAATIIDSNLYTENSNCFSKYVVNYDNEIVLKLAKRPIADIALQGMKNSIKNSFNKIGISEFDIETSRILNNTLKFVDVQNS